MIYPIKKLNTCLFLLISFISIQCKKQDNISTQRISLNPNIEYNDLSDILILEDILVLDQKTTGTLSQISKIEMTDHFIWVLDRNYRKLLKFDKTGTFLTEIGKEGRGPGEYYNINDFAVSESDSIVDVLSLNPPSTYTYDLSGNFKTRKKNPFIGLRLTHLNSDTKLYEILPQKETPCLLTEKKNEIIDEQVSIIEKESLSSIQKRIPNI